MKKYNFVILSTSCFVVYFVYYFLVYQHIKNIFPSSVFLQLIIPNVVCVTIIKVFNELVYKITLFMKNKKS